MSRQHDRRPGDGSGGSTFDLKSYSASFGGLAGSGTATNSSATAATLTITGAGGNTFSGVIAGGANTALTVNLSGGVQTLTGNNTYAGATTISAGTLAVGNGGTGASIGSTSGVVNNGTLVFNHSDAVTFSQPISGSGGLVQQGAGTLTLSGSNTFNGAVTVTGGVLKLAPVATSPVSGTLLYDLDPSSAANYTLTGGSVTQLNDLSGNGNNFTNPSSTVTVVNGGSAFNGKNVLYFNFAANSTLTLAKSTSPETVFIVDQVIASHTGDDGLFGYTGQDHNIRVGAGPVIINPGNGNDFTNGTGGAMYVNGALQSGNVDGRHGPAHRGLRRSRRVRPSLVFNLAEQHLHEPVLQRLHGRGDRLQRVAERGPATDRRGLPDVQVVRHRRARLQLRQRAACCQPGVYRLGFHA